MSQVDSLTRSAVAAFHAGNAGEAQALCEEGLKLAPEDTTLHHLLANVLFAKGDALGAASHVTPSLRRSSANPPARKLAAKIGHRLWELGEAAAAASLLTQIADATSPASLWFELGRARQDLHDHAGAEAAYRAALARQPTMAEAAVNLGAVLQGTGDMTGAMKAYGTAYRLRPETFDRIAEALDSAPQDKRWLDPEELKRALSGR